MAGSLSRYLKAALLEEAFGAAAFTAPATLYLALYTVAPTDNGGGTEVTGGSYARKAVTNNTTNFAGFVATVPTAARLGETLPATAPLAATVPTRARLAA